MSVTTSTTTVSQSVLHVLADYELTHSPEHPRRPELPNAREDLSAEVSNPATWPEDHRRVPPHRPIDYNLDRDLRPGGLNPIEALFIATMLNGVRVNAVRIE